MPRHRTAGTWTTEQARQNAAKGAAAKWARHNAALLRTRHETPANGLPAVIDFSAEVLDLTRARLRDLFDLLDRHTHRQRPDTADLRNLALSVKELAELERRLAGRPLPGTRKPVADSAKPAPSRPAAPILPITQAEPSDPADDPTADNYG